MLVRSGQRTEPDCSNRASCHRNASWLGSVYAATAREYHREHTYGDPLKPIDAASCFNDHRPEEAAYSIVKSPFILQPVRTHHVQQSTTANDFVLNCAWRTFAVSCGAGMLVSLGKFMRVTYTPSNDRLEFKPGHSVELLDGTYAQLLVPLQTIEDIWRGLLLRLFLQVLIDCCALTGLIRLLQEIMQTLPQFLFQHLFETQMSVHNCFVSKQFEIELISAH